MLRHNKAVKVTTSAAGGGKVSGFAFGFDFSFLFFFFFSTSSVSDDVPSCALGSSWLVRPVLQTNTSPSRHVQISKVALGKSHSSILAEKYNLKGAAGKPRTMVRKGSRPHNQQQINTGVACNKKLGQHLLKNPGILDKIVSASDIKHTDTVSS